MGFTMKYIVVATPDGLPAAVIFSEALTHFDVAKSFKKVTGAGFCNAAAEVWWHSESLNIESKPADAVIVRLSIGLSVNPKP